VAMIMRVLLLRPWSLRFIAGYDRYDRVIHIRTGGDLLRHLATLEWWLHGVCCNVYILLLLLSSFPPQCNSREKLV
jgi:hypothetical protein